MQFGIFLWGFILGLSVGQGKSPFSVLCIKLTVLLTGFYTSMPVVGECPECCKLRAENLRGLALGAWVDLGKIGASALGSRCSEQRLSGSSFESRICHVEA